MHGERDPASGHTPHSARRGPAAGRARPARWRRPRARPAPPARPPRALAKLRPVVGAADTSAIVGCSDDCKPPTLPLEKDAGAAKPLRQPRSRGVEDARRLAERPHEVGRGAVPPLHPVAAGSGALHHPDVVGARAPQVLVERRLPGGPAGAVPAEQVARVSRPGWPPTDRADLQLKGSGATILQADPRRTCHSAGFAFADGWYLPATTRRTLRTQVRS